MTAPRFAFSRTLLLAGLGALIGLALAGYALFTARGTSTLAVPPEDVALVNRQPIARSDYLAQLRASYDVGLAGATAEQRRHTLDDMIREELFVQRGNELDVSAFDPSVRSALVSAVEGEIAADAMAGRPSLDVLQAYYASHRARYSSEGTMIVRDLVFPPAQANAAAQALQADQPADAALATFGGRDSGRVHGEEFYFAAKIHLGETLFQAAQGLADGKASPPLQMPDGSHVLLMIHNTPPVPLAFADAASRVLTDQRNEAVARLEAGDARFFRERANILIAPDLR